MGKPPSTGWRGHATVRPAAAGDLDQLGVIGPASYAEAYAYLWDRPDAYARQLSTFGRAAFADLLGRPEACAWVAETGGGAVIGFLTMALGSEDPVGRRPGGAEIPRIYLLGPARGLGLGRRMLDAAAAEAVRHGASHLWLDAMASAGWARRAYGSWGFREIGAARFDKGVKEALSGMVVMVRDLARPPRRDRPPGRPRSGPRRACSRGRAAPRGSRRRRCG